MGHWIEAVQRGVRYRITAGGLLFATALGIVGAATLVSGNNLLFLVLATMLSVVLVSGLLSRLCLAGLELDFVVPEHVAAGRTVAATLAIRNVKGWMPSFSIHVAGIAAKPASGRHGDDAPAILTSAVYFPVIAGGATLEESVDVRFARRGAHRQNSFSLSTRFPFGFLEKGTGVSLVREVIVYPSIDPEVGWEELFGEINGDLEAHYRGRGMDFYRIRPYEPLESARHVDWKATAHMGQLQVREFSREAERAVEIYLDRNVRPGEEEAFERAVNCCAFIAWRLTQQGASVRFQAQDFRVRVPEEGDVYTMLKYLALVIPIQGKAPGPPLDETSFQIVFSPDPQRLEAMGWTPSRVLDAAALAPTGVGPVH